MKFHFKRIIHALDWWVILSTFLAVAGMVSKWTSNSTEPSAAQPGTFKMNSTPFFWLAAAAVIVGCFQTWVNYRREWYDYTLALKYQDLLERKVVVEKRQKAARQFKEHKKYNAETREVEAALDLIEDIGFYVRNHKMSVEVAHHHFYFWIRGYVQTGKDYIATYQIDDPLAYEYCEELLKSVTDYEAAKLKCDPRTLTWDEKDIEEFLEGEIEV
jgi:hypothetical protein